MLDIMKKQHGVDIDPEKPNVEVISLLDVEKSIDVITTAIQGLSAKMTKASSTTSSSRNSKKSSHKRSFKKASHGLKKA
jgi:hypothetical protein